MKDFFQKNLFIILLATIATLNGIVWATVFPLFQGNDEHTHYSTIQNHNIPDNLSSEETEVFPFRSTFEDISTQNISPELRSFLEQSSVDTSRFKPENTAGFNDDSPYGKTEDAGIFRALSNYTTYRPLWRQSEQNGLYYVLGSRIEKALSRYEISVRAFFVRMLSVFFGTASVVACYYIFLELGLDKKMAFFISLLISFQPMFTYTTSYITIDSIVYFGFSLFILCLILIYKNGLRLKYLSLLAFSILISILTKKTGQLLIVYLAVFSIFFGMKVFSEKKSWFRKKIWIAFSLLTLPIFVFGVSFWMKYSQKIPSFLGEYFSFYPLLQNSKLYWGLFGNFDAPISRFVIYLIWLILAISCFGIIALVSNKLRNRNHDHQLFFVLFFLLLMAILHLANLYIDWPYYLKSENIAFGSPGRYYLPLVSIKFYLIVIGLLYWLPKKIHQKALIILLAAMIILNHYSLFNIIIPRFYL